MMKNIKSRMLIVRMSFYTCLISFCFNMKFFLLSINSLKSVWGGVKSFNFQNVILFCRRNLLTHCDVVVRLMCNSPFYIIRKLSKSNGFTVFKYLARSLKRLLYNEFQLLEKQFLFFVVVTFVIKCYYCSVENAFRKYDKIVSIGNSLQILNLRYSLSQVLFVCSKANYTIRT